MAKIDKPLAKSLRLFEVVAFGCHERARDTLRTALKEADLPSVMFNFVEYFLWKPVVRNDTEAWNKSQVFFPFVRRIVEDNEFVWWPNGAHFKYQPKTLDLLAECSRLQDFVMPAGETEDGKDIFKQWCHIRGLPNGFPMSRVMGSPQAWNQLKAKIGAKKPTARKRLRYDEALLGEPWKRSKCPLRRWLFPIASNAMFFGYFILLVSEEGEPTPQQRKNLRECFQELVDGIYLPVLTLLHETLYEAAVSDQIKEWSKQWEMGGRPEDEGAAGHLRDTLDNILSFINQENIGFYDQNDVESREKGANSRYSSMERALADLWHRRRGLLEPAKEPQDWSKTFEMLSVLKGSLLFERYNIASPGMIKAVKEVMLRAPKIKRPNDASALPAALVFGTPGSGKDTIARMIPLFSNDYFKQHVHTINMAALQPDFLTGPLIQGLTPPEQLSRYALDGIFVSASKQEATCKKQNGRPGGPRRATFILDELNSMNVGLQGILLRILEQGEVTPLFGIARTYVHHLIIGVVNENPEVISREREIHGILIDKEKFGTLLGGLLYEVMRGVRRLRDDLYHRLRRQLYVVVPEIDSRREDIPILFYVSIINSDKKYNDATLELGCYRLLMNPAIRWSGNVRQIQSVARRVIMIAEDEEAKGGTSSASPTITQGAVLTALRREFPAAYQQSNNGEET